MRIIAGRDRGRRLAALGRGDAAAALRPTADRVREALFSTLQGGAWGDPVAGAVVLDLFAGTGALGLEALSRGAARAVFVETGRAALRLLRENITRTGNGGAARILARDATRLGPPPDEAASLVFLDPPYGRDLGGRALIRGLSSGWIATGAIVVWEESAPQDAPAGFATRGAKRYGETHVTFLEAVP